MPLLKNPSGLIINIEDKQLIYEAVLKGFKIVSESKILALNEEIAIMLRTEEIIPITHEIKPGVAYEEGNREDEWEQGNNKLSN